MLAAALEDVPAWRDALAALDEASPVDLAIVNAGAASTRRDGGGDEPWEAVEAVLAANVRGALATAHALVPGMVRRGRGQVALVSSLAGFHGLPVSPAYSASKAALKAYGEAMRAWLAPLGISVCVVMPGFVATPLAARYPGARPFELSAQAAARRIRRGLARGEARIAFPWPLAAGAWLLAALPAAWAARLARRFGY